MYKGDLRLLMHCLYSNASSASAYQFANLFSLIRYLFGRASDLTLACKQNLLVDGDFLTCTLHVTTRALMTQQARCCHARPRSAAKPAGVLEHLTSYSFFRGGVQHTNDFAKLSALFAWPSTPGSLNRVEFHVIVGGNCAV